MYLCACHIDVSYFYDFYAGFLNCSDYVAFISIVLPATLLNTNLMFRKFQQISISRWTQQ